VIAMKSPNLTIIFIVLAAIVLVGLAGGVVLTIADKDATPFYGFFTATLATVVAFGGIIRGQSKIDEKVTQVSANVNGRLSQLIDLATSRGTPTDAERAQLEHIIEQTGVTPTVDPGGSAPSRE
jgi:hypothetical protein